MATLQKPRPPLAPVAARVADTYLRTRVLTSPPIQLVLDLYDRTIVCLERALVERSSRRGPGEDISRAIRILGELDLFLDYQRAPEISAELAEAYEHLQAILAEECIEPSRATLLAVIHDLRVLREAWRALAPAARRIG